MRNYHVDPTMEVVNGVLTVFGDSNDPRSADTYETLKDGKWVRGDLKTTLRGHASALLKG